jgi:hypothetical protein
MEGKNAIEPTPDPYFSARYGVGTPVFQLALFLLDRERGAVYFISAAPTG